MILLTLLKFIDRVGKYSQSHWHSVVIRSSSIVNFIIMCHGNFFNWLLNSGNENKNTSGLFFFLFVYLSFTILFLTYSSLVVWNHCTALFYGNRQIKTITFRYSMVARIYFQAGFRLKALELSIHYKYWFLIFRNNHWISVFFLFTQILNVTVW